MIPRLYEFQCTYCSANAVLNRYCRNCETHQPTMVLNATKDNSDDITLPDFHEQPTKLDLRQDTTTRTE